MRKQQPAQPDPNWRDLRNAKGRLFGRIDERRLILEIKRNDRDETAHFDLRQYIKILKDIASREDTE